MPEWIEEGRVHTLADSSYVLIEFSPAVEKRELTDAVKNICSFGYRPVLAHVERYDCLVRDPGLIEDLIGHTGEFKIRNRRRRDEDQAFYKKAS